MRPTGRVPQLNLNKKPGRHCWWCRKRIHQKPEVVKYDKASRFVHAKCKLGIEKRIKAGNWSISIEEDTEAMFRLCMLEN